MRFTDLQLSTKAFASRAAALLVCFVMLASVTFGQKSMSRSRDLKSASEFAPQASVAPIVFPGSTIWCDHLNSRTNAEYGGAFTRMTSDDELIFDFSPTGTFDYRTYSTAQGQVTLSGNQPGPPTRTINISTSGNTVVSFNSQVPVMAVIVRAANTSYVYSYSYPNSPVTYSDSALVTGNASNVNRVTICYGVALSPSAGPAAVSGRVVDVNGNGISGARLTIADASTGASMTVRSNGFGYYLFDAMPAGQLYTITIADKRYTFVEDTRTITLNEDLSEFDFVANP